MQEELQDPSHTPAGVNLSVMRFQPRFTSSITDSNQSDQRGEGGTAADSFKPTPGDPPPPLVKIDSRRLKSSVGL